MDLETIIPIIIVAVAYLFKAFEDARKKDKKKGRPAQRRSGSPERPDFPDRSVTWERRTGTGLPERPSVPAKPAASGRVPGAPVPSSPAAPSVPGRRMEIPETSWWDEPTFGEEEAPASPPGSLQEERARRHPADRPFMPESSVPVNERLENMLPHRDTQRSVREASPSVRETQRRAKPTGAASQVSEQVPDYAEFDLEDAVIKSVILERREF